MRSVALWYDVRLPSPVGEKVPAEQGYEFLEVAVGCSTIPCLTITIRPSSVGSAESFSPMGEARLYFVFDNFDVTDAIKKLMIRLGSAAPQSG